MANRDLQEIPKFEDNWSYVYFEKGHIVQEMQTVAYCYLDKKVPIPIETLSLLMLGPGTTITHEAVKRISDSRCMVLWTGDEGVRFYSAGYNGTYSAAHLLRQVHCYANDIERMKVVRYMYRMRFDEVVDDRLSLEQLRGKEGARVRKCYRDLAEKFGVEWNGRNYDQSDWQTADPLNRALSAANSCLYGLCHAAILAVGCSPGIGFIHTGKQMSFVYDIADLYKTEITIPIAFAEGAAPAAVDSRTRQACREKFRETRLIERIIPDIMEVLYGDRRTRERDPGAEGRDVAVNY